jgi:hypothetical protein
MPAQIPTEQERFVDAFRSLDERSQMRDADRQSRQVLEAEQEREARERGEMVMADVESYVEPDDALDFAPALEARRAMRQQREEELAPMYEATERQRERRREVRRQRAEEEQLQQLLDDAGELVEGADDRDLGDFDPDRYERGRDFDRERDFE